MVISVTYHEVVSEMSLLLCQLISFGWISCSIRVHAVVKSPFSVDLFVQLFHVTLN